MKPLCHIAVAAALVGNITAQPCAAAEPADVAALLVPVNAWVNAFNQWDAAYPTTAFTKDAIVIDQFPNFLWHGKGSAHRWWIDLMGATKEEHERDRSLQQHVEFEAPQFVHFYGKNAYFVQAATLTWVDKKGSHTMKANWVATETKTKQGWRISSHAWAPISESVVPATGIG